MDADEDIAENIEAAAEDAEMEAAKAEKAAKDNRRDSEQEAAHLERITAFLGKKVVSAIEGDEAKIDISELTVIDAEIIQEFIEMSDDWLRLEVERLEKEANTLEHKLKSGMTLREQADYDQHVPFSI